MTIYLIAGVALGFAAAVQPGPFITYLVSRVVVDGWRRTVPAVFAPLIAPFDPLKQLLQDTLQGPSGVHLFGTDQFGRDNFTRVLFGARISLRVGLISVSIACLLGIPLGLLAGYYQSWVDLLSMRLVDLLLAFPAVLLAMAIMTVLGPSLNNAMMAVGISIVPQFVRISRGSTLTTKTMDYVTAARTVGCSDGYIMFRHILPNVLLPLIVLATLQIAAAILFAASDEAAFMNGASISIDGGMSI